MTRTADRHLDVATRQVLASRAEALARPSPATDATEHLSALVIDAGGERFAFPLESVERVLSRILVSPMPGFAHHWRGLAAVRGELVAVLDLAEPLTDRSEPTTVVVLAGARSRVGITAGVAPELAQIRRGAVAPAPPGMHGVGAPAIVGVAPGPVALIDASRLIDAVTSSSPLAPRPPLEGDHP